MNEHAHGYDFGALADGVCLGALLGVGAIFVVAFWPVLRRRDAWAEHWRALMQRED